MLDFCVGLDTEFSEVVEGSHLYFPKTKFEQVCIDIYTHTLARMHAHTHTHIHTHTLACTHTHTHTHTILYLHTLRLY